MKTISQTVLSAWSWFVLGVSCLVYLPIVAAVRLVTLPFDPGAYWAGYVFRKVVMPNSYLNPLWSFSTSGELPGDMRRPYVAVANHESFVDMVAVSHLPTEFKWMSKTEIMKIPVLGWLMRLARDVPLERGKSTSGADAIEACHERLSKNTSVMIFPEGRRSRSGELGKFRAGAFKIAIAGQHPILPMAIYGTRDCLLPDDWRQHRARAEVRVLDPISTEGLTEADLPALRDQVREIIAEAREQLRQEHAAAS